MSEWQLKPLDQLVCINPSEKLSKGTVAKKIGMEYLLPFTKRLSGYQIEEYKGGTKFRNGDTLLARITPCLENGKTAYVNILDTDEVAFGSTEYIVLRELQDVSDKQFIYYFSRSEYFRDIAIALMTGSSGRQRVQTDSLSKYLFEFPPLPEQKAIADVLSALDDKIDLLQRQNETLEKMAETLFRQWFIEEAKEDWEEVTVGDFVKLNSSSINKNYTFSEILYLDTGSLTKGVVSTLQPYNVVDAPSRAKRLVQHDDILISTVRPNQLHYGLVHNPQENLVVSTGFCTITSEKISPYFIYLLLTSEEMTEYLHSIAEGSTSTYPSLKPEDIGAVKFNLPDPNLLKEFHILAKAQWEKIHKNYQQIKTLQNLRDTLLPKLMSGEVRVKLD